MSEVLVLGAGMAGLGAAHRLRAEGVDAKVYEKLPYSGGHAASFHHEGGYVFDDGPHISFTKDERVQSLFAEAVGGEYETLHARVNNYWKGYWIKHPAQVNLHGLPEDLLVRILADFVRAHDKEEGARPENYAQWLVASFGRTFAETFPMVYGLKYHTTEAANMSTDWLGPRLYRPELEEVLRGILSPSTPDVHYVSHFRYPTRGGFGAFLRSFEDAADIRLGEEVVEVDPGGRTVRFAGGRVLGYEALISSIPLPELIPRIVGAPQQVREAASRLAATSCVTVNLGVEREDLSEAHWSYFYDPDLFFTRASFPHMFSPHNAPPGVGTIQAEVYYSQKYRPVDRTPEACIEPVIRDMRRCGIIREQDRIVFQEARFIPYANVIFDLDRAPALEVVHGYLDSVGIRYAGRYGEWGYHWTDDALLSGEKAAQSVLDGLGCGQGVAP